MTASLIMGQEIDTHKPAGRRLPPSPQATVIATVLARLGWLLGLHIHSHVVGESGFNAFPYGGLDDGRYYYTTAQQLADGITPPYVLNSFPRVLAVFMNLGIRDLLALKLISFAVSSIAVVMIASLAWHLSAGMRLPVRRWTVVVVSVLGSLFPSNVFWTTNSLMRDGWILSFALLAIWSFSGAGKRALPRARWALGFIALAAATSFRPYVLPIYFAALVSSGVDLLNPMRRLRSRVAPVVLRLTLLAVAFIGGCLLVAPTLTDITGFDILAWRSQEQLSGKGSSMGLRFDGADSLMVVPSYLYSFVSNAIGPLPFQIRSANQMLAFVELPFFIVIVVGLFRSNYNNRLVRFCALFGLYWLLLLGLWNDVLGNAARNRIMAWPILAIAASPAIAQFLSTRLDLRHSRKNGSDRRRFDRRAKKRRGVRAHAAGDERQQDPFVPALALALANFGLTDQTGIRTEMGRRNDERRLTARRDRLRRSSSSEIDQFDDQDGSPPLSARGDFPLFRPPDQRDRSIPVRNSQDLSTPTVRNTDR